MLVIARKIGQTIRIGDEIEVTVSAIRGDQVRLAIQAPREIPILRTEIIGVPPNSSNGHVDECAQSAEAVEAPSSR
jgi:carbon storage regulator CsrA